LVSDVFTGKGTVYFAVEGHMPGLANSFGAISDLSAHFGADVERLIALVPFIALALFIVTIGRCSRGGTSAQVAVCLFTIVGFVGAAPDFAAQHVSEAVPLLLALPVIGFGAMRRIAPNHSRWRARVVSAATIVSLAACLIAVASWARRPSAAPRNGLVSEQASPVAGLVTTRSLATQTNADLAELRSDTNGTVYLAFLSASYYYLVDHLRDPTPFDYPGRSDLGSGGEHGLIQSLRRRRVNWVCVANRTPPPDDAIRPLAVERYIRTHLRLVEVLHVCDLYTLASTASEATRDRMRASSGVTPD
jgi:hypothetical protein